MIINITKLVLYSPHKVTLNSLPTSCPINTKDKSYSTSASPEIYYINLENETNQTQ